MVPDSGQTAHAFAIWVAANLLAFIGVSATISALPFLRSIPGLGIVWTSIVITLPIGLAQWLVLRGLSSLSLKWVSTLPAGWILFWLIASAIPESMWAVVGSESTLALTTLYIIMGAAVGLPQWLMLRRECAQSLLWLASCALGVGLGFWIILASGLMNRSEFMSYVAVVLVYGVATGAVLSRLLTRKADALRQQAGSS